MHNDKKTILVTAASGNAGRASVEALLNAGFNVVATSRDPKRLSFTRPVETRTYDANQDGDMTALLKGIDALVMIGPPLDALVHEKMAPMIRAAASQQLEQLVYLSGNYLGGFSGKSLNELTQRQVELQIIDSGIKNTLVRASFFMDNYTTGFYASMVADGNLVMAVGDAKSALVAACDVGEFIAATLSRSLLGEYIVTGPEALDHDEIARMLSQRMGRAIKYTPISLEQLESAYKSKGLPPQTIKYGITLYRAYRDYATAAITDSFKQATGREPVSMKAFLGLTA